MKSNAKKRQARSGRATSTASKSKPAAKSKARPKSKPASRSRSGASSRSKSKPAARSKPKAKARGKASAPAKSKSTGRAPSKSGSRSGSKAAAKKAKPGRSAARSRSRPRPEPKLQPTIRTKIQDQEDLARAGAHVDQATLDAATANLNPGPRMQQILQAEIAPWKRDSVSDEEAQLRELNRIPVRHVFDSDEARRRLVDRAATPGKKRFARSKATSSS